MMWLLACTIGTAPQGTDKDPSSEPLPEATQVFDDGTETCMPQVLADTTVLPSGETVGDLLAVMRAEVVAPTWFDGRAVGMSVSLVHTGDPVTVDLGCSVRTPVELSLVSDDGAVQQTVVTEAMLYDSVRAWVVLDGADWMGTLASTEFLSAPCPQGETWRLDVDQASATSSGFVRHACEGTVQGGEPGSDTDTGTDDTDTTDTDTDSTDTDTTSTTLTGTLPPTPFPDDTGDTAAPVYVDPPLDVLIW
jgi:hypothetical protein